METQTIKVGQVKCDQGKAPQFNLGTGIFPNWNDKHGIMICGYEWGGDDEPKDPGVIHDGGPLADAVFSNKVLRYGSVALTWRFDRRILRWFELWGHPLDREGLGGDFEKTLIQTNWCNTQSPNIKGDIWRKLLDPEQVDNFLAHVRRFEPRVLLFFGSVLIKVLQNPHVLPRFKQIVGNETGALDLQRRAFAGRRFTVGFQSFQRCEVVCLPHPSGSRSLSDEYIALFGEDLSRKIAALKSFKGILS